jgi:cell fate (sporulation/competence/biofilm development) regulator YlbF (YheA/YmcA/DUF963 family)
MPVDTQQLMDEATKIGQLAAQHPAVARYKQARDAVDKDAEANRLLSEFDRQIETLTRQQQAGMQITDAQQHALETMQSRIVSHIKIKAMKMAEVEFVDLLRKITQTIQRQLAEPAAAHAGAPASPASQLTV